MRDQIFKVQSSVYRSVNESVFRDTNLNLTTRGLLGYLLTRPDGWKIRFYDLLNVSGCGRDGMQGMIKEMCLFGYAMARNVRMADGTLRSEVIIFNEKIPEWEREYYGKKVNVTAAIFSRKNSNGRIVYNWKDAFAGTGSAVTGAACTLDSNDLNNNDLSIDNTVSINNQDKEIVSSSQNEDENDIEKSKPNRSVTHPLPHPPVHTNGSGGVQSTTRKKTTVYAEIISELAAHFCTVNNIPISEWEVADTAKNQAGTTKMWRQPLIRFYLQGEPKLPNGTKYEYDSEKIQQAKNDISAVSRLLTTISSPHSLDKMAIDYFRKKTANAQYQPEYVNIICSDDEM